MSIVLYWAGIGLAALLAVVLALLAVPVVVRVRMAAEAALSWSVQIRWLFGLVRLERGSAVHRPAERAAGEQAAPAEQDAARQRDRRRATRGVPGFVTEPVVWRRALRLLRTSLRGLTLHGVEARIRFGLADPADTGSLYGMLAPAMLILGPVMPGRVAIAPDFERAGITGRAAGELRIVPLRVLAPIASFGVWLGLHNWRKRRRP